MGISSLLPFLNFFIKRLFVKFAVKIKIHTFMKTFFTTLLILAATMLPAVTKAQSDCPNGATGCEILFDLHDRYGDGWSGNSISVYQGATLRGVVALNSGTSGEVTVAVCPDSVSFVWTSGSFASDVSFTIYNADGSIIYECSNGMTMLNGATFAAAEVTCPTCLRPVSVSFDDVDSTSLLVSWPPAGMAEIYEVAYGPQGFTPGVEGTAVEVYDTTAFLVNLSSNTSYDIYVRSICLNGTDTSNWRAGSVRTACGSTTLPYSNNFDSDPSGQVPSCWSTPNPYTNYNTIYPNVSTASYQVYGGNGGSVELRGDAYLVSPYLPVSANKIDLMMTLKDYYHGGKLQVGFMSDPTDTSTFVLAASIDPEDYNWHTDMEVSFGSIERTDSGYVAFRLRGTAPYGSFFVDNLEITRLVNCSQVNNLRIRDIAANTAVAVWEGDPMSGAYYQVGWSPNNNPETIVDSMYSFVDSALISGLVGNVTYYVWVRSICAEEGVSRWKSGGSFTTDYECGLTDLTVGDIESTSVMVGWTPRITHTSYPEYSIAWRLVSDTVWHSDTSTTAHYHITGLLPDSTYQLAVWTNCARTAADTLGTFFATASCGQVVIGYKDDSQYSTTLPISTSNGYSYSQQLFLANEVASTGDSIYGIYMDCRGAGEVEKAFDIYLGITERSSFGSESDYVHADQLVLVADSALVLLDTGMVYIPFQNPYHYQADGNLVLAINYSGGYMYPFSGFYTHTTSDNRSVYYSSWNGAVDVNNPTASNGYLSNQRNNVRFVTECPVSCHALSVFVDSIEGDQVLLSWSSGGLQPYSVEYRQAGDEGWTAADTTSGTGMRIGELEAGVLYEFRVSSSCGAAGYANAYTECGTITLPYYYDFINNEIPYCWNVTPATHNAEGGELYAYGSGYVILPEADQSLENAELHFKFRSESDSTMVIVGIVNAIDEPTSFYPTDTLYGGLANEVQYLTGRFAGYPESGLHAAVYLPQMRANHLDNIQLGAISTCPQPVNLTVSNVGQTSATLSWISDGGEAFSVEYGIKGYTDRLGTFEVAQDDSLVITGLQPATDYEWAVRTLCVSDSSYQTLRGAFTTECGALSLPQAFDFESAPSGYGVLPNCWTTAYCSASDSYYQPSIGNASYNAHSGNRYLSLMYQSVLAMPEIADPINTMQMSFYMIGSTWGDPTTGVIVGVMDDPEDTSTFVPVDTVMCVGNTYRQYTVYFNNYLGTGRYPAIHNIDQDAAQVYCSVSIDDIELNSTISCIPPQGLTELAHGDTSITLGWTEQGSATMWQIAYDTILFDPEQGNGNVSMVVASNPVTIGGLTPKSDYYFYVRSICAAGDTSVWSNMAYGVPASWTMQSNRCDTIALCGGVVFDQGGRHGSILHGSSYDTLVVLPAVAGTAVVMDGYLSPIGVSDEFVIYSGVGTEGQPLVRSLSYSIHHANDLTFHCTSTDTTGALTILYHSGFNQADGYEVNVSCTQCLPPVASLDSVTPYTAVVSMLGDMSSYVVRYRLASDTVWSYSTFANTDVCELAGLENGSRYFWQAARLCDGDTSDWNQLQAFATLSCYNRVESNPNPETSQVGGSWKLPVNNFYEYSYSQQIFDSAEMGGYKQISAIRLYLDYNMPIENKDNVTIYMGHTIQSTFGNLNTFVDANLLEVYRGAIDMFPGWNEIVLDSKFEYNGFDNLVIAFKDESDNADGVFEHLNNPNLQEYCFRTRATDQYKAITLFSGASPINPATGQAGELSQLHNCRNEIVFVGCDSECPKPVVRVDMVSCATAQLSWTGTAPRYELNYRPLGDTVWTSVIVDDDSSLTVTGLIPATPYMLRIRQHCDIGVRSEWTDTTFTTLMDSSLVCMPVSGVVVSDVRINSAVVDWEADSENEDQTWVVRVAHAEIYSYDTVFSHPYTILNLYDNTEYRVSVRRMCGEDLFSEWSDPVSFNTPDCQVVSNVVVSNVTSSGATINWTPGSSESEWEVIYGRSGFGQNQGILVATTVTSYQITGLEEDEDYDVYVRAKCAEGIYSDWSPVVSFTTIVNQGIDDIDSPCVLRIYPNPTSDDATISLVGVDEDVVLEIVDMNGRVVERRHIQSQMPTLTIGDLSQGAYFVRVVGDKINATRKLIVR